VKAVKTPARYRNELKGIPIKKGETLNERDWRQGQVEVDMPLEAGDSLRSKIKQVASGRFGVTAEYSAQRRSDSDQDGARRQAR
jgi:glutamate synthase (NADPH/NADH) large chain/glutamate synthase (ferredoxin)